MTSTGPGTRTVLRTARKSCGECSPEIPGVLRQVNTGGRERGQRQQPFTYTYIIYNIEHLYKVYCKYSNVREVTIYNSSLQLCMWKSKDLYHLYQKNQNLFLFCTKMTYFVTFFVMKRYKLLLFSTKKSHIIVTLQYLKDTNHYFVKRKRYKTLLFCRKRHISLLFHAQKS